MKLPRLGDSMEDRLLEEAASIALITGEKIVDLSSLPSAKNLDVRHIGLTFQKRGYGRLIEVTADEGWNYHFSLTAMGFEMAAKIRAALRSRTVGGRLARLNWNAVNAVAAWVAAIAALIAAYYSYLSFVSNHVPTH